MNKTDEIPALMKLTVREADSKQANKKYCAVQITKTALRSEGPFRLGGLSEKVTCKLRFG